MVTELVHLVARVRAGDLHAYGLLVDRFRKMAVGYAEARLGDHHLAEDAAQDAFIHAYLAIDQLQDAEAFPGWLRQIVSTYCARLLRRSTHRVAPAGDEVPVAPGQEDALERREVRERLNHAVAALPEAERTVTHLFYFEDLSQKDIASFLELSLTTVKYRLYASRQRLKLTLEGEFADMVKQTTRPDRPALAARVQKLLKALESLHKGLASRLETVLSDVLKKDVQVRVDSVEQTTAADFVGSLSVPCCTYQFRMSPLRGMTILDIAPDLACVIAGHGTPGPMTLAEYALVVPTLTLVFRDFDSVWKEVAPIRATNIELETHPGLILDRDSAQETVVHVALEVTAGDLASAIHMSYEMADLEYLRPYLGDGVAATLGDLELPPEPAANEDEPQGRVTIEAATPDLGYFLQNMVPLYLHDQAAFGYWSRRPNRHGVMGSSPTARNLTDLSELYTGGWWKRPEVFQPLVIRVDEVPAGSALVEAPPVAPEGVQYYLSMFFLHNAFRDDDTYDQALRLIFDRHRGEWEVNTYPGDHRCQATLHRFLSHYVGGRYRSGLGVSSVHGVAMMSYRFRNAEGDE